MSDEVMYNDEFIVLKQERRNKMATFREEAQAFVPTQTKNIAELEQVSVEIELKDGTAKDKDGVEFTYKYAEIEGEKYRVPGSVIGDLKGILKMQPHIKQVTVSKTGEGMGTRYQVMPYIAPPKIAEEVIRG